MVEKLARARPTSKRQRLPHALGVVHLCCELTLSRANPALGNLMLTPRCFDHQLNTATMAASVDSGDLRKRLGISRKAIQGSNC